MINFSALRFLTGSDAGRVIYILIGSRCAAFFSWRNYLLSCLHSNVWKTTPGFFFGFFFRHLSGFALHLEPNGRKLPGMISTERSSENPAANSTSSTLTLVIRNTFPHTPTVAGETKCGILQSGLWTWGLSDLFQNGPSLTPGTAVTSPVDISGLRIPCSSTLRGTVKRLRHRRRKKSNQRHLFEIHFSSSETRPLLPGFKDIHSSFFSQAHDKVTHKTQPKAHYVEWKFSYKIQIKEIYLRFYMIFFFNSA